MKRETPVNLPASVHQRLLNLSQQRGEEFNLLLTRFAIERLLYRLSCSAEAGRFVLKGALAFAVWGMQPDQGFLRPLDPGPRIAIRRRHFGSGDQSNLCPASDFAAHLPSRGADAGVRSAARCTDPGGEPFCGAIGLR